MTYRRHSNLKAGQYSRTSITGSGNVLKRPPTPETSNREVLQPPIDGIFLLRMEGETPLWNGPWYLRSVNLGGVTGWKVFLHQDDVPQDYPFYADDA